MNNSILQKRIFSILLSVILITGLNPATLAFALPSNDQAQVSEQVDSLNQISDADVSTQQEDIDTSNLNMLNTSNADSLDDISDSSSAIVSADENYEFNGNAAISFDSSVPYKEDEILVVYDDKYEAISQSLSAVELSEDKQKAEELADESTLALATEGLSILDIDVVEEVVEAETGTSTIAVAEIPETLSVEDALQEAAMVPGVAHVQPNYVYELIDSSESYDYAYSENDSAINNDNEEGSSKNVSNEIETLSTTVNDPYFVNGSQYYLSKSNILDAWDKVKCNNTVEVAVLDSGCNLKHPDLVDNLDTEYAYDVASGDSRETTEKRLEESDVANNGDGNGHGTHVCGIVAATANNGIGIAGVSYNATVLPVKVFYEDPSKDSGWGSDTSYLIKAYEYLDNLMDQGKLANLRVINMSVGTYTVDYQLEKTIDTMLSEHDVLSVCAAGNKGSNAAMYPSDYESCISVMGLTKQGTVASYSDQNDAKDIYTYGTAIYSTLAAVDSAGNYYGSRQGTSQASPQVAGVAALLFAMSPTVTAQQVREALLSTGTTVSDAATSAKALDASAAVDYLEENFLKAGVSYTTHVENIGWQNYVADGDMAGTSGKSLRLEGIKVQLNNTDVEGSIQYQTHIQNIGWQGWVSDGEMSGTSGQSLRLEAIRIELTGDIADQYDVYYRVHAQNIGWMAWAKNGESAGTSGYSYRLEGIQIVLVEKDSSGTSVAPGSTYKDITQVTDKSFTSATGDGLINYTTHVQNIGWQDYVSDGVMAGTSGKSLRLEGIKINLGESSPYTGGITYTTHVQNIGWQDYVSDNAMAGTSGQSLRLEAIKIKLTGEMANHYDVYYRVHTENIGWMGWAKNGESAGSAGYSYRLEGIQIVLVEKDSSGTSTTPSATYEGITQVTDECFIQG